MSMDNAFIATTFDWDHRTPTAWQLFMNKAFRKLRLPMRLTPAPSDMANVEARMNLFHLLEQVIAYKVPGDVVDLGCNAGDSTIVMQKVVSTLSPERQVHAYDSFEGLPELTGTDVADGVYGKGYMAAPLDLFKRKFDALGLRHPHIHKGWFQDTVPQGLPERIAFALIDGDLYESTKQGFITLHHRPCQQDPKLYQAMLLNQQGKYVAGCWTYRAGVVLLAFGPNTLETRPLASYSQIPSKYLHDIKAQGAK